MIRQRPGYAAAAILIMAAGIGASTAVFSVVSGVLLKPLPFAEPERLVVLRETVRREGGTSRLSAPTFSDWRAGQRSFTDLAAYSESFFTLISDGEPRRVEGAAVSVNWFGFLGVRPVLGRGFLPDDDGLDGPATVILAHDLWVRRFRADSSIIGRAVTLDDEPYEVVGIAPPGFDYPGGAQLWTPLFRRIPAALEIRGARFLGALGRLAPGVGVADATADLNALNAGIPELAGWGAHLTPLHESIAGRTKRPLLILLAAVTLVLLIASANVTNLVLAQAATRRREFAIRSALGASRARIAGALLAETLCLSAAAGALGLLLAAWSVDALLLVSPVELPRAAEVTIDWRVLAFAVGVSLVGGIISGLAPAYRSSRTDLTRALKEGGRALAGSGSGSRLRSVLVVGEVGVTLVLLAGAALLLKSFATIVGTDPGLDAEEVLTFELFLPDYRYGESEQQVAFQSELLERLEAQPGVEGAALASNLPFGGAHMTSPVSIEGRSDDPDGERVHVEGSAASPGYFSTLGVPVLEGREFEAADVAGSEPVAVVNEAFAREFFPEGDAIGQRATTWFAPRVMRRIVGVVADIKHTDLREPAPPVFYTAMSQAPSAGFRVVVRSDVAIPALTGRVRAVVWDIDPELPLANIATLEELVTRSVGDARFYTVMLGSFAVLALIIAGLGFYAVLTNVVAQRRREIGIRMAVGARSEDVIRMVLVAGLKLTAIGVALGLLGALALTRALESLLYDVAATDPAALGLASIVLVGIAIAATLVPARHASRVDPLSIMKE